ncbi:MAG TPA: cation transporter [Noviherbaspirillum sp.]|nr:cation transporter [Noviherbaspirillum sp.]
MYELQVEGMSCGHCVNSVTKSVQALDASAKVDVDLSTQRIRVTSTASLEDIKAAVLEAGYAVINSSAS